MFCKHNGVFFINKEFSLYYNYITFGKVHGTEDQDII